MEETQKDLLMKVGNEEMVALKPARVKVESVEIGEFGVKKSKKVVCSCKHPDKAEAIKISSCKYEAKGKLEVSGLWINKDSKDQIRKGSALAVLMQISGATTIGEIAGRELETTTDEKGYLTFKVY